MSPSQVWQGAGTSLGMGLCPPAPHRSGEHVGLGLLQGKVQGFLRHNFYQEKKKKTFGGGVCVQIPNLYFCGGNPSSAWCPVVALGGTLWPREVWGQGAAWSPALHSTSYPRFGCSPRETRSPMLRQAAGSDPCPSPCRGERCRDVSPIDFCLGWLRERRGPSSRGCAALVRVPSAGGDFAFFPPAQPHRPLLERSPNLTALGN